MIEFEDDQCDWTCQCIYRDVGLIFRTNPLICRKNMLVGRNNGGQNCQIASQLRPFPKGSTDKELGKCVHVSGLHMIGLLSMRPMRERRCDSKSHIAGYQSNLKYISVRAPASQPIIYLPSRKKKRTKQMVRYQPNKYLQDS